MADARGYRLGNSVPLVSSSGGPKKGLGARHIRTRPHSRSGLRSRPCWMSGAAALAGRGATALIGRCGVVRGIEKSRPRKIECSCFGFAGGSGRLWVVLRRTLVDGSVPSQVVLRVFNAGRCRVGGGRPFGAGLLLSRLLAGLVVVCPRCVGVGLFGWCARDGTPR